jgi:hypothetical protein
MKLHLRSAGVVARNLSDLSNSVLDRVLGFIDPASVPICNGWGLTFAALLAHYIAHKPNVEAFRRAHAYLMQKKPDGKPWLEEFQKELNRSTYLCFRAWLEKHDSKFVNIGLRFPVPAKACG